MSRALAVWAIWKHGASVDGDMVICYSTEDYGCYKLWNPLTGESLTCSSDHFNWMIDYMEGSTHNGSGFASVFVDRSGPVCSYVAESADGASYRCDDFGTAYAWAKAYTWSSDAS